MSILCVKEKVFQKNLNIYNSSSYKAVTIYKANEIIGA